MDSFDFPVGVHTLHNNTALDFQLNRLAGLGGGDLDEIREVAPRIGDLDDWKREFLALGERALAEKRIQHAAAYFRAAEFNMAPGDPDKAEAYERQAKLFEEIYADDLATGRLRRQEVPYEGGHLPAWRITVLDGQTSKGTIVIHGGFDSYGEELYPLSRAIADAGYETVLFEGPGQGSVMRRQGIHFTTEWERPVKAVLDHFGFDDVTLIGLSLGGYLAPRAAAFEPRIRRVVAFGVMWDFFEVALSKLPTAARVVQRTLLALGARSLLDKGIRRRMKGDPLMRWGIEHGCYVFGVESPSEYIDAMRRFTTREISSRIKQDFLLLAGDADHYIPIEHYHAQARALTNVRSFTGRIFTAEESAQTHCQVGNLGLALRVILDWIDERTNS
jgi:pimeloyl-ACP methyl ester carboxylesterase